MFLKKKDNMISEAHTTNRMALQTYCKKRGYNFNVEKRYLDSRALDNIATLEKLWIGNRDKVAMPDEDIITYYVILRNGGNRPIKSLPRWMQTVLMAMKN